MPFRGETNRATSNGYITEFQRRLVQTAKDGRIDGTPVFGVYGERDSVEIAAFQNRFVASAVHNGGHYQRALSTLGIKELPSLDGVDKQAQAQPNTIVEFKSNKR